MRVYYLNDSAGNILKAGTLRVRDKRIASSSTYPPFVRVILSDLVLSDDAPRARLAQPEKPNPARRWDRSAHRNAALCGEWRSGRSARGPGDQRVQVVVPPPDGVRFVSLLALGRSRNQVCPRIPSANPATRRKHRFVDPP